MIFIPLFCLIIIWGAGFIGFQDDLDIGLFGRMFSAFAHMGMAVLMLATVGFLTAGTIIIMQEIVG